MSEATSASRAPISVQRAVVRGLSANFAHCEREDRGPVIDVDLARVQHQAYVDALRDAVGEVIEVPASEHPDCVFVEDTAIILDADNAFIPRLGALSRRGETAAVADVLRAVGMKLTWMTDRGCLDGGDVLRVGQFLFVGLSTRTDEAGAGELAHAAELLGLSTVVVEVPSGLHMKTGCSLADEGTLLYAKPSGLDVSPFERIGLDCLGVDEPMGGNVLALGGGRVLVSDAAPRTAEQLLHRSLNVRVLAMSELHKADAALTCPSLRVPAAGGWCT